MQKDQRRQGQTPQRFYKLIEAGDLSFLVLIQYAIVIFGITKHGKTTFAHHLVNNPLEAYKNKGGQTHYRLSLVKNKASDQRIGATMQSQTQIPNQFSTDIKVNGESLQIIDNPGQKDSFGINRVLSNAYFHYRIFSKVKNMKFVLVFDFGIFSSNVKETNEIFQYFFKSFDNFNQLKPQLLKSIALVFTKVEKSKSMNDIKERIGSYESAVKKTSNFSKDQLEFIQLLLKQCKDKQKIKIFRQAELGVAVPKCNDLKQIHEKLQFFSREIEAPTELISEYYNEQKVSMKNIKFSETQRILAMSQKQVDNNQINVLFDYLSTRGGLMFSGLFNTLKALFQFLTFQCENVLIDSKERLLEVKREKVNSSLQSIIRGLQLASVSYDNQEKYEKRRQQIICIYTKKLDLTPKCNNFIERLYIVSQIYKYCQKYTNYSLLNDRRPEDILSARLDIQLIVLNISQLFSHKDDISMLSQFLYNIYTYMNQLVIFSIIILPPIGNAQSNIKRQNIIKDSTLGKFLDSLNRLVNEAVFADDHINSKMNKQFNLNVKEIGQLSFDTISKCYLQRFPTYIIQQKENILSVLKSLSKVEMVSKNNIQCVFLMFKELKNKYCLLVNYKALRIMDIKQNVSSYRANDIKRLISSFVFYLKQLKKVKELVEYKEYKEYRDQTYQISYLVWTYLTRLFHLLLEIENRSQQQNQPEQQIQMNGVTKSKKKKHKGSIQSKQAINQQISELNNVVDHQQNKLYKEIIIQILLTSQNYSLVQETFTKFNDYHIKQFQEVTLQSCAQKINEEQQKAFRGHQVQCMTLYENERRRLAKLVIKNLLQYVSILIRLGQKEDALEKCYQAIKYGEHCPQEISEVQQMIDDLKIYNNLHGWTMNITQKKNKNCENEASITTRKQLKKFLDDNAEIGVMQCVKLEFLK